jgi:hypothetical protein
MSEDRSRFKIKKEDIEIEYEGKSSEVTERYREAFEWIKTVIPAPPEPKVSKKKKEKKEKEEKKPDRRGGTRSNIVSRAIDDLITEGWLDTPKKASDVFAELQRRTVPGAKLNNANEALKRRVPRVLDRIKDTNGKWTYVRQRT